MKRICAITMLLALAMLTAAPAWAFTLADHACCVPQPAAKATAKTAQPNAAKHSHCAAMAAKAATQDSAISAADHASTINPLHRCGACDFGTMSAPRDAATFATVALFNHSQSQHFPQAHSQLRTLQASTLRDSRGPPSRLL